MSDEELARRELKKDTDAISALLSSARSASMALSKRPLHEELTRKLKVLVEAVKKHQTTVDDIVFGSKLLDLMPND